MGSIRLRRHIGYVIQDVGLFPHFTVERNVALVPALESWPDDKIRGRVREMLELVGLGGDDFREAVRASFRADSVSGSA